MRKVTMTDFFFFSESGIVAAIYLSMWFRSLCNYSTGGVWKDLGTPAKEALGCHKLSWIRDSGKISKDHNADKNIEIKDQTQEVLVGNKDSIGCWN